MARWRLLNAHYLKVPGNEWEYKETDRSNGRQIRRAFDVPQFLNPYDPQDWNYKSSPDEGEIIVTNQEDSDYTKDYVFLGDPTPDMEPIDDEAKAISASFANQWKHPIESLSGNYSQSLIDGFQAEMAKTATKPAEDMKELTAAITAMAQMQGDLIAALAGKAIERRA